MNRAAIYARFSTDLQNERSIDDQLALCRTYAEREGLNVVATFDDRARSGGSVMGRDGLLHLMDKAREHEFDVLVVEALDRLSRDMDLAGIHKRLSFLGIEIRAVHEGVVNTVLVGLRGLVGQLYREDNAHKVRRGQAGRVKKGLHAGGLTYGYSYVPGDPGKRLIAEDEAEIVRRIFREYVDGQTPRDIAHNLNRDSIPPPRGRAWNASTINGNAQRGTGLLQNELYVGRLIWNRVRMVKDPDSGKRVSRPNPKGEWRTVEVPDLAIISPELFEAARERKKARTITHPSHQRRPRHMLSGLLRCGACGAGMSSNGKDKSRRIRIRCSAATESGTCPDPKTFYLDTVETAVLDGLTTELRHPDVIAQYVQTYHEERRRLAADTNARRTRLERRLGELSREIERLINAIAKGHGDPAVLGPQSTTLNEERKCIVAELDQVPAATGVIALHPAVLARYEEQLNQLQIGLAKGIVAGDSESAEAMRDLIETVTVFRDPLRIGGIEVEIAGRLTALLGENAFPNGVKGVWGKVVAGEGLEPPTPGL
ncbi:recombinase family protein [Mesorhizobium sp. M00.F.Ca.ET.216.01.1.1]|uniref:recombinase family protein n=1 Tax=Mesorhizobium sp. M00.F.Ca.ET.216.01.1.1 TaxID=2500528 RepID=UPI000FDAF784|nr:recombinase family protein [Mesorhizobium sp. M00.F.Ca.ET.216.01.1.1]TGQ32437.1 recombinase family protein [Mesorhizobium sp. M00.F.Ca.ET.216.01.1.1]